MSELLNQHIKTAIETINQNFVYRKLGCCYDYRMPSETDFSLKSLPNAGEINQLLPDKSGKDTGMYNSILNNCLLFDGLAYRFEVGFAEENEYVLLDRLIGGTIRLATIAPKNLIIRGLSADGRYFYNNTDSAAALLWHHTAWRITTTPTVSPASQIKLINIASRWFSHFANNNYTLPEAETPLGEGNDLDRLKLSAILAFNSTISRKDELLKEFDLKFSQDFIIPANSTLPELLVAQLSLNMISSIFAENSAVTTRAAVLLREISLKAVKYLNNFRQLDLELLEKEADPDWRNFSAETPTISQQKYSNEENSVTAAAQAMYIILNSSAQEIIKENAETMAEIIQTVPWEKLSLASALTALPSCHCRGVDLQLWDKPLEEFISSFTDESTLVAEFLTDDYDDKNPSKAGHTHAPKKKLLIPADPQQDDKKNRKRRKKRKNKKSPDISGKDQSQSDNNDSAKASYNNDPGNKQPVRNSKKKRNRKRKIKSGAAEKNSSNDMQS